MYFKNGKLRLAAFGRGVGATVGDIFFFFFCSRVQGASNNFVELHWKKSVWQLVNHKGSGGRYSPAVFMRPKAERVDCFGLVHFEERQLVDTNL